MFTKEQLEIYSDLMYDEIQETGRWEVGEILNNMDNIETIFFEDIGYSSGTYFNILSIEEQKQLNIAALRGWARFYSNYNKLSDIALIETFIRDLENYKENIDNHLEWAKGLL